MTALDALREHPEVARLAARLATHKPEEVIQPGARRAAVLLILRLSVNTAEPEMLFIQRAHYETDPWSGQIAFPGGREEPGDTSLVETAVRETREETGIDVVSHGEILGPLDDLRPIAANLPPVVVRPFVALLGEHPEAIPSLEVAACFWAPLGALRNRSGWRETVVTASGQEFSRLAFHHQGFVVWGMTERILSRFLDLAA